MENKNLAPILLAILSGLSTAHSADGIFDNLTATGDTTFEGPVQIDDTAGASTPGQWNLTLENGLFIWGNQASSTSLGLDFAPNDTVFFWYPDKAALRVGQTGEVTHDESNIGSDSTAWGYANTASGEHSTAWGKSTLAESYLATTLGTYNIGGYDASNNGNTAWSANDPLLEVGIGTSIAAANALTVLKDGRIALGHHATMTDLQTSPETLQVQGAVRIGDDGDAATVGAIRFHSSLGFQGYDGSNWLTLTAYGDGVAPTNLASPAGSTVLSVDSNERVGVGTTAPSKLLDVNGDAIFSGEVTIGSVPPKGGISMGVYQ